MMMKCKRDKWIINGDEGAKIMMKTQKGKM
jgi:hypothetical protein